MACKKPNERRFVVRKESMGRAVSMCRELAPFEKRQFGRQTMCIDPSEDRSRAKVCKYLLPSNFETIVPPSYYVPSELKYSKIPYECSSANVISMMPFPKGPNTTHVIIGPLKSKGHWQMYCLDEQFFTNSLVALVVYVPTSLECDVILKRWQREISDKNICPQDVAVVVRIAKVVTHLQDTGRCSDQLYKSVKEISSCVSWNFQKKTIERLCMHIWHLGMYSRRWAGPGRRYPFEETQTLITVLEHTTSEHLRNKSDEITGEPLDYISDVADGSVGLLINCIRMHSREALNIIKNRKNWMCGDKTYTFMCANYHARALVPRQDYPSSFVHSILPYQTSEHSKTLEEVLERCATGRQCIRTASVTLLLTAIMIHFAVAKSDDEIPWMEDTLNTLNSLEYLDTIA